VKVLQRVRVVATIPDNRKIDSVRVQIENPERLENQRKDGLPYNVDYKLPGKLLLNLAYPVTGNKIDVPINIPLPVKQKELGSKLRIYGWSRESKQTIIGLNNSLYFSGIDVSNVDTTDKVGPSISVRLAQDSSKVDTTIPSALNDRVVIDGFVKNPTDFNPHPAVVEVFLSDSAGIDIFGESVGEGITVSVKGVRKAKNYNSEFKPVDGSPNCGKLSLFFNQDEFPAPGEYEMIVSTSDFLRNRSEKRFTIEVKSTQNGVYDIGDFYAYPSPVNIGDRTRFYFNAPTDAVHQITLKIFTLSGKLVRSFKNVRPGVEWNLRDEIGNQLSPNIYLYRLYVERDKRRDENSFSSGGDTKEIVRSQIRKMAILPPR
jgi:hypothetical protein